MTAGWSTTCVPSMDNIKGRAEVYKIQNPPPPFPVSSRDGISKIEFLPKPPVFPELEISCCNGIVRPGMAESPHEQVSLCYTTIKNIINTFIIS